jgi:23S rRNA A2030 N6-methylase RlmJ
MRGSGLLVVNSPWKLRDALAQTLPWLATTLGGDASLHRLEWLSAP